MNSREDYLSAIYRLTNAGSGRTKTSKVSKALNISDASASESIQKLEEDNLVCRVAYRGFTLSPMGKKKGEEAKEKFETLKNIFEKIGMRAPETEADSVEHSISTEAVEKLELEILGN
jgi:DtxR family Mn-dependent transcriptional regulator